MQEPKDQEPNVFVFGTKAETLERLQGLVTLATIPELYYFPIEEWSNSPEKVLDVIQRRFGDQTLAVRSSALIEDGDASSMAGAYLTELEVSGKDRRKLAEAIDRIRQSMTDDHRDQILVQLMAQKVTLSGVMMTFDIIHGAPYYCIEYDDASGRTDVVTGGSGLHKGLLVYRNVDDGMVRSRRIAKLLQMARQLEHLCGCAALDIEFALTNEEQLMLLQVRRIVQSRHWHPVTERRTQRALGHVAEFIRNCSLSQDGILGRRTIFAVMSDWNPAEIIGTTPRPLSASLYRELITREVWHQARAEIGYRPLADAELMVIINSHPYINVRNSFNSFLPAGLDDEIGIRLVESWLDRLEEHPEFHDKVEFEIVPTCMDFCFDESFRARYPGVLSDKEYHSFRSALTALTRNCLTPGERNTLNRALADAATLSTLHFDDAPPSDAHAHLLRASYLISQAKNFGTRAFAIVARHAFIAEALLRSAVRREVLSDGRLAEFRHSIRTITSEMVTEYALVCRGDLDRETFLAKYGHLRPGTYEITSLRYDEREDLFLDETFEPPTADVREFSLSPKERLAVNTLLSESNLDVVDADQLLLFARNAIAGREHVKFVFTRVLSDALSSLLHWGQAQGLSRDDLSYLDWPTIKDSLTLPIMDETDRYYLDKAHTARRSVSAASAFHVAHIIFGVRDIYVATINRSMPNFVGIGSASGQVVELTSESPATINIKGRIICIENADPGFDWIFTKGPSALVTRFGGANSHMAIRCAELNLPAAIGCGDQIYRRIVSAGSAELNCMEKILRSFHEK